MGIKTDGEKMDIQKPLIHLNGSGASTLIDALNNAYNRCADAVLALGDTAPNARDYYPLGDSAFTRAREEHRARVKRLTDTMEEIQQLLEHVIDHR